MERLRRLIHEIHRRSLWQVLGIYLLASWAVLQVVDTLGGALNLPDWFPSFAFALLLIGLPVVLATAFVQEGTLRSTSDDRYVGKTAPATASASDLLTWRNALVGGVLASALWGLVAAAWMLLGGASSGAAGAAENADADKSVAVLPFVNMSGNPDNEYFSDGITEELINALAQLPDLRVPGRTSSFAFKGQNLTIRQIADTLDVAHVLEGSVRRDEERVLITAQLVEADTDTHVWSNTYERELEDIFSIQREIATAIAEQLRVTLSGENLERLVSEGTRVPGAHDAYLRGQYLLSQRTPQSVPASILEFQRAIALDADYADSYSGLAEAYLLVDTYAASLADLDFETNLARGLEAARRAVSLAPDLGIAQTSLGFVLWSAGEWEGAEAALLRAIVLSPGYATAYQRYALLLMSTGRASEAVIQGERAFDLDPISPIISVNLGWALLTAGRTEEAIEHFRASSQLAPGFFLAWLWLAEASLRVGDYDEGLGAFLNMGRLLNQDSQDARATYEAMIAYRETGDPQTFPGVEQLPPTNLIWVHERTGQLSRAEELFQLQLVRPGAYGMAAWTGSMLDDLRYQALLEDAGITW